MLLSLYIAHQIQYNMVYQEITSYCLYSESKGFLVRKLDGVHFVGYEFKGIKDFSYEEVKIFHKRDREELFTIFLFLRKEIYDLRITVMKLSMYPEPEY
jgi:hypothetical protein